MADKIYLVQGDTRPQIKCVVSDETTGQLIDLTGATVVLKYRAAGGTQVLATLQGSLLTGKELEDGSITFDEPFDLYGAGGRVVFTLVPEATNQEPGAYEGEIEITFADGAIQTVYKPLKFTLRAQF
jgi:hypothetical protein